MEKPKIKETTFFVFRELGGEERTGRIRGQKNVPAANEKRRPKLS